MLEYFEGIMFLTTNREGTIDTAFESRIHLRIHYPPLTFAFKKELWRAAVTRACSGRKPHWLRERLLRDLGLKDVNGREIQNIVRIAHTIARSGKREMNALDIEQYFIVTGSSGTR